MRCCASSLSSSAKCSRYRARFSSLRWALLCAVLGLTAIMRFARHTGQINTATTNANNTAAAAINSLMGWLLWCVVVGRPGASAQQALQLGLLVRIERALELRGTTPAHH